MNFSGFILCFCILLSSCSIAKEPDNKVLVFYKTAGFYHESIPVGLEAIKELGKENDFGVSESKDADIFQKDKLASFDLIIFLNTTGDILNDEQQKVFEEYIDTGGSFFGIHSASDTEFDWPWFGELVGAYFMDHPEIQEARIVVENKSHPVVAHLPEIWERTDEWYNYKEINPEINLLLRMDESSYKGGKNGEYHPISWYRNLKQGGVTIYTGLGHTADSYREPAFLEHLKRSILFALENKKGLKE